MVGSARTYVVIDSVQKRVVGYHALAAAELEREAATERVIKGMPQYPIPVVLLTRLAIDLSVAGRGLGDWLLRDAMPLTLAASATLGVRAMLVHAIDEEAWSRLVVQTRARQERAMDGGGACSTAMRTLGSGVRCSGLNTNGVVRCRRM
jgi:hypothetical protein